jgi:lipopolysaccharide kinase (Kdo/WaaP) family protein
MRAESHYQFVAVGNWRVAALADLWNRALAEKVFALVEAQPRSKHPQTLALCLPSESHDGEYYLKVFHPAAGGAAWKDLFRDSKAFRASRLGIELAKAGFAVPLTIATGEERHGRLLGRAFILSKKLAGQPAPVFLRDMIDRTEKNAALTAKRAALRQIAVSVRRFHQYGFVHGDLVASNIFVSDAASGGLIFYFMDNDRTRRYPVWLPQSLWKRNLIQLNRMPLPGITLQDRMRFLQAYLNRQKLTGSDRRLARWLERKTRQRRRECDGVDASGDFRQLMRWS